MPLSDDNVNIGDIKCNKSVYVHTSRLEDVPSVLSHRVLPVDFYFLICAAVENINKFCSLNLKKSKKHSHFHAGTQANAGAHFLRCGRLTQKVNEW